MDSIPQMVGELVEHLDDFNEWEEAVNAMSQGIASEIGSMVMRAMDDCLFDHWGIFYSYRPGANAGPPASDILHRPRAPDGLVIM